MPTLELVVQTGQAAYRLPFAVRRVINAGYTGRNREAVLAHIAELAQLGIPAPPSVPALFPVSSDNVTTDPAIEVLGPRTSGEAEYVLFLSADQIYVGVGSDHTDRELEGFDLARSKQICKNVVSSKVWPLADVLPHWDQLELRSWVGSPEAGGDILYQEGCLRAIIHPEPLLELVRSRAAWGGLDGLVLFSGTLPVLTGQIDYSDRFRTELLDPATSRRLSCSYRAMRLDDLAEEGIAPEAS
jgi:hypothetical protein